ncbi:N-acetylgalactosamine-6-sulfatase [Lamellibrachia satsuma]|nr:N-acetylgalactosamine-6-sulfatase [Lamellibrachia satsuma]
MRTRRAEAVRKKRAEVVRTRRAEVVRKQRAEVVRTRRAEAVRKKRAEVMRTRRAEAVRKKRAEVVRTRRADVVRKQRAEVVRTRRAEVLRKKRAEVVRTSRAEVVRTRRAEVVRMKSAEVVRTRRAEVPVFFYRGNALMAVRHGPYKAHLWTWATPEHLLKTTCGFCPGQMVVNVTTSQQVDHSSQPILFHLGKDPGEKFFIKPSSLEYQKVMPGLRAIVAKHEAQLVRGKPQLNWCDEAVQNWAPPGCEKLNKCLKAPPSNPFKCDWDH